MKRDKKGFTLIELLVVIAIIGILATIVLVSLNSARQKARDTRRIGDLRQVALALEMYYDDNRSYPAATQFCAAGNWAAMSTLIQAGGYMSTVPTDPTGTVPYVYGIPTAATPQRYVLIATLEAHNAAHDTDLDGDPVSIGGVTYTGCNCGVTGTTERLYCIAP